MYLFSLIFLKLPIGPECRVSKIKWLFPLDLKTYRENNSDAMCSAKKPNTVDEVSKKRIVNSAIA